MEERNNNTGLVVLITVLVMVVLGLVGFIVYDKVINKTNEPSTGENNKVDNGEEGKEEVKEISINDSLITSLVYPVDVVFGVGYADGVTWKYQDITINDLTRANMMHAAAYKLKPIRENFGEGMENFYSAKEIEDSFKNMFGPDTKYTNGDIEGKMDNGYEIFECGQIYEYNENDNTYMTTGGCGGDSLGYTDYISKKYKAEQTDNYIYVYEYVQSALIEPEDPYADYSDTVAYLLDHDNKKETKIKYDNYKNTIYSMIDKGEVETYKWTFKKQSDGKYYFYSGAWEN